MGTVLTTEAVEARPHRPWLAATLSFVFPGLGQAYSGRRIPAIVFALPVVVLIGVVAALAGGRFDVQGNSLLSTGFLFAVLIVNGALFLWRAAAIAHAGLTPVEAVRGPERRNAIVAVVALLVLTLAMHAWIGGVVGQLEDTLAQVFAGEDPDDAVPPPSHRPDQPAPSVAPEYRWDGTERINVLLLGTDAAPGRKHVLTDVILVVSVDPVAETAVMVSVPRDTGFVPLPDRALYADARYPDKVNGLYAAAARDPGLWCPDLPADAEAACGLRTIESAIGLYLGIDIHHYALVDMAGFAELIDALGGLELCLPGRLVDPQFDGSLLNEEVTEPLVLPAGCHQYDGLDALAYARSRKGWIEMPDGTRETQTDFSRSERQQAVLLALRDEMAQADTFLELPAILSAIGNAVSTDFPRDQAGDLASLVPLITGPDIDQLVLGYPEYVDLPTQPDVNYLLIPKRDAIRDEMADVFGEDELSGWFLATTDPGPAADGAAQP